MASQAVLAFLAGLVFAFSGSNAYLIIPALLALIFIMERLFKLIDGGTFPVSLFIFYLSYNLAGYSWLWGVVGRFASDQANLFLLCSMLLGLLFTLSAVELSLYLIFKNCLKLLPHSSARSKIGLMPWIAVFLSIAIINQISAWVFPEFFYGTNIFVALADKEWLASLLKFTGAVNLEFITLLSFSILYVLIKKHKWWAASSYIILLALVVIALNFFTLPPQNKTQLDLHLISGSLTRQELKYEWAYYSTEISKISKPGLILLPETAYNAYIEYTSIIPDLITKNLRPGQAIILGSKRMFIKDGKQFTANSAYLLEHEVAHFQVSSKKYLVPFAENSYSSAPNSIFEFNGERIALGICFEALANYWYRDIISQNPAVVIFLSGEYFLTAQAARRVNHLTQLKMAELGLNYAKVTSGSESMVLNKGKKLSGQVFSAAISTQNLNQSYYFGILYYLWPGLLILLYGVTAIILPCLLSISDRDLKAL